MGEDDIRWEQRFSNYKKALFQLENAVGLTEERDLSNLEEQGLIQSFEYTHELAWKCMKDFIQSRGNLEMFGSKDVTREAFQLGLIEDGEGWMNMIRSRNLTHTYNQETADQIANAIVKQYIGLFRGFRDKMETVGNERG